MSIKSFKRSQLCAFIIWFDSVIKPYIHNVFAETQIWHCKITHEDSYILCIYTLFLLLSIARMHSFSIQCFPLFMFLLVETRLWVRLHQLRLSDLFTLPLMRKCIASGYCFVLTWSPSSSNFEEESVLGPLYKVLWHLQNWTSISFLFFFPSWCWSSRQRMRWITFWRLVPGRREITGQQTSLLRSTSCGLPKVRRWQTSKILLDLGYTTSIWGKSHKQKCTHRLCSIVHMLNLVVFSLPHPADGLLWSLLVHHYIYVSF